MHSPPTISYANAGCNNARSLLLKFDELSVTVNTLKPHIICIVESWLSSEINDCEILIPGFQLYRFDRHHHGGGVLNMYVSDEFLVSVLLLLLPLWKFLLYLFCLLILNFTYVYFVVH